MTPTEIERLSAFLDGELPPEDDVRVAKALGQDEELAAIERGLRDADAAFRRAARSELDHPASISSMRAIRDGFAARRRGTARRWAVQTFAPLAASLVVVAMGGFWLESRIDETATARDRETARLIDEAVQNALETAVSGSEIAFGLDDRAIRVTPTRTYKSRTNHWCREFVETTDRNGESITRKGVACRDSNGQWRQLDSPVPSKQDI